MKFVSVSVVKCLFLLALVLGTLSACAPRLGAPGNKIDAAYLADDKLIAEDGTTLPLRSWLPEGKPEVILLGLHGFNDYSNAFEGPGSYWAKSGIATYAYDQRGFGSAPHPGLWGGHQRMTADLRTAAQQLRQKYPGTPLYVVGISMGGAVVMAALQEAIPLNVDGVILSAPAVWSRQTMPWYQRASLWLVAHTTPWASFTGSGLKIQASDNIPMLIGLGRDPLVIKSTRIDSIYGLSDLMDAAYGAPKSLTLPTLLLYGEKDEVIPWGPTRDVWQSLPNGIKGAQRAALYENGWHMLLRDLQAETVLFDIKKWVQDQQAPLPSGADKNAQQALKKAQENNLQAKN